jgi:hypothetical protein
MGSTNNPLLTSLKRTQSLLSNEIQRSQEAYEVLGTCGNIPLRLIFFKFLSFDPSLLSQSLLF